MKKKQLFRVMRLLTLLLFGGFFHLSAATYSQTITLSGKNMPLADVFKAINQQTGFRVMGDVALLRESKPVTVAATDTPLPEFLSQVFNDQPVTFRLFGKTIMLEERDPAPQHPSPIGQEPIDVKGVVVDEHGRPLAGASVMASAIEVSIAGNEGKLSAAPLSQIAISNARGEFLLKGVKPDAAIVVSFLGYQRRLIKAAADVGTIVMTPETSELDEVNLTVNTGYQTLSRERSAGSFAKPDMAIVSERTGTVDIIQRLDGLVPGLVINNSSSPTNGPVGSSSSGSSVMIRGLSTLNANREPLVVLNGVPIDDISTVNPNDVANITVLKDATAASIWGARATNGVIVITTKQGSAGEKTTVNYNGFVNFLGKPQVEKLNMLDSRSFIQAAKDVFDPVLNNYQSIATPQSGNGVAPIMPHETILYNLDNLPQAEVDARLEQLAGLDGVAQMKELFYRNALLANQTLAVSGGNDRYRFYGSGSYIDDKNSRIGDNNRKYGLSLRQDYTFNRWIKVHLIADFDNNDVNSLNTVQPTAAFLPYVLFRHPDGSPADLSWLYRDQQTRNGYETLSGTGLHYAPLDELNTGRTAGNTFTGMVNSGVTINLLRGLRYEGVFNLSKAQTRSVQTLDQENYAVRSELVSFTPLNGSAPYLPETGARRTSIYSNQKNWTVRNQFVYDNAWNNDRHSLILLAGQEAQEQLYHSDRSVVRGYNSQLMTTGFIDYNLLSAGVGNVVMPTRSDGTSRLNPDVHLESESLTRVTSYYASSGYTFNNRYTLNAATRIDQSNLFGKDKSAQNKPLWSVGVAWQAGREPFADRVDWLDRLTLRTSYGLTGNSPNPGMAASQDILETLYIGQAAVYPDGSGLVLATPANRKLTWETTKTLNAGIDFALLNNRVSGTIDVYDKRTQNLIAPMLVNPLTGYSSIIGNAGDLSNKGVDVNLNTINIATGGFTWSTLFNFSYNKNKLTKINRETPITRGDQLISNPYVEGYSAFAVFAYPYAGLDDVGDPQIQLQDGTVTKQRSVATIDDMKYMGTFQPVWSGGLSNTFAYHGLSLRVNAIYNLGHVLRRDVNTLYGGRGLVANSGYNAIYTGNINAEFSNRWKQPGDERFTDIPAYSTAAVSADRGSMSYYTNADRNVVSASYIKLRDVTLAYRLPSQFTERLRADAVSFHVQLSNVMLWKANSHGIDPEFMDAYGGWDGSATIIGIYQGGYRKVPVNQGTLTFGANISF